MNVGAGFAFGAACVAFGAIVSGGSGVQAAILNPGDNIVVPTPLPTLPPGDSGAPLASESMPFTGLDASNNVKFTGTLFSAVYSNTITGGLDFVYQVSNDSSSLEPFDLLSLTSFSSYSTDADYVVASGNVAPDNASRSATPGKIVRFNFYTGVAAGLNTDTLIVETNANRFVQGTGSIIDGAAGGAQIEAPSNMFVVPEPGSVAVITLVGGILLGRRRR